jgi:hypothetical protein
MCCNILEKRIQPEPFSWFGILTKYNATHYALLNSADAEQARSHSKSNSQDTADHRRAISANALPLEKNWLIVKRLRPP